MLLFIYNRSDLQSYLRQNIMVIAAVQSGDDEDVSVTIPRVPLDVGQASHQNIEIDVEAS